MSEHAIRALESAIRSLVNTQAKLGERLALTSATMEKLPAMLADQSQVVTRALAEQTRLLADLEIARAEAAHAGKLGQLALERAHLEEKRERLQEDGGIIRERRTGVLAELTEEANRRVRELDGEAFDLIERDFLETVVRNYAELYSSNIGHLRAHYSGHVDVRSALLRRAVARLVARIDSVEERLQAARSQLEVVWLEGGQVKDGEVCLSIWRSVSGHRERHHVHSGNGMAELSPDLGGRVAEAAASAATRPLNGSEVEAVATLIKDLEPRAGATEQEWPEVVEEIRSALARHPPRVFAGGEIV